MNRRRFLTAFGTSSTIAVAGCSSLTGSDGNGDGDGNGDPTTATSYGDVPPVLEDRPNEPYFPTHIEGMSMVGMQSSGDYRCALTFTYPHRFWLVTGTRTRKVVITREDSVHLMPVVWNATAGLAPPDISPQVSVSRDGETVADFAPWPMLSQPMGFHFGDNVELPGDGTYTVTVAVGSPSGRRTGDLSPNDPMTFEFDWDYRAVEVDAIDYRDIDSQREGLPGAVPPMDMPYVATTQAPKPDALAGTSTRVGVTAGAEVYATRIPDATAHGGNSDQTYVAVSPRTKYNRYILPMQALSATLTHDGDPVHDGPLAAALDPDLGYHYGVVVDSADSGTELDLTFDTPPQVARHEGYETAFVEMDDLSATL